MEDNDKDIAISFLPKLSEKDKGSGKIFQMLHKTYNKISKKSANPYKFYNMVEKKILSIKLDSKDEKIYEQNRKSIEEMLNKIKTLSIELMRYKPLDWNNFMDALLSGY